MFKLGGIPLIMAERIILIQQPLSATLYAIRKGNLMPSDSKFVILEEYIATMKPIVEITGQLGEKNG